jgi:hypothetical protein
MEAPRFSESWYPTKTLRYYNPEDVELNLHCSENFTVQDGRPSSRDFKRGYPENEAGHSSLTRAL